MLKAYKIKVCLLACIWMSSLSAKSLNQMNDIRMDQFGDFQKDWRLVTARFREDTKEIRLTYANDLAWETLNANKTEYPDGAVFAKFSVVTAPDPDFPSSATPLGKRRTQYMVRDQKKFSKTQGWGYALFDAEGLPPQERQHDVSKACAQCHDLVKHKGYVFSQLMGSPIQVSPSGKAQNPIEFSRTKVGDLPDKVKKLIPSSFQQVQQIQGALSTYLFSGTLDEIRPSLAVEAVRSQTPALLLAKDKSLFSIVISGVKPCPEGKKSLTGYHNFPPPNDSVYEIHFCH